MVCNYQRFYTKTAVLRLSAALGVVVFLAKLNRLINSLFGCCLSRSFKPGVNNLSSTIGATPSTSNMSTTSVAGRSPFEKAATGQHKATLIWFHGLGDQGHGWLSILSPTLNKLGIKVICPNAATRPVTLNFGMQMPAWFDLKGLTPDSPEDIEGINLATQYVHTLIQKEIDSGLDPKKIIVGGFSMGGALALHAALTYKTQLGALVAFSGFLLQRDAVEAQITSNKTIPTFIGHGTNDFIVPLMYGQLTANKIKSFNPNVVFKTYPADHSAPDAEIQDAADFIKKHLSL